MTQTCVPEKEWPQILAIFIVCLTAVSNGMLFAWTSPFILVITKDQNYNVNEDEAFYLAIIPGVGMLVAVVTVMKLADSIGRKYTILLVSIPQVLYWIITIFAHEAYMFYIARILFGISDGTIFSIIPMYTGEISTPKVRSTWTPLMQFDLYIGMFFINLIGSYFDIKQSSYISLVVPIIFIILFPFIPESPYYYLMKKDYAKAEQSLKQLRGIEDVTQELSTIKEAVERQLTESGSWKELFVLESNRKALYIGAVLEFAQQLGGVNVCLVFTQYIFDRTSMKHLSPQVSTLIFMVFFCVSSCYSGLAAYRLGTRRGMLYSLLICGASMLIEAIYFYVDSFVGDIDVKKFEWVPLAAMLVWVIGWSIGISSIPTLMLGELFPANVKSKGICFTNIIFSILMTVSTFLFYILNKNFDIFCPFLFTAIACFVSIVLSYYYVPETASKTLEEIQMDLRNK